MAAPRAMASSGFWLVFSELRNGLDQNASVVRAVVANQSGATFVVNGGFDDVAEQSGWTMPERLEPGNYAALSEELADRANRREYTNERIKRDILAKARELNFDVPEDNVLVERTERWIRIRARFVQDLYPQLAVFHIRVDKQAADEITEKFKAVGATVEVK